jgi:alpha-mannosidase
MLHDVEFLSALAHACRGFEYPQTELDRLWKIVLTNQFHDIIPGSSINLVYQDSNLHYTDVLGSGATLRNQAAWPLQYPYLELTLTDAQDQPVVRRALLPTEYAGGAADLDAVRRSNA